MSVFLNPWASTIPSVPCSFSLFLPSCLLRASRGQTWIPRAGTNQFLPYRLSQSVVCFFLSLEQARSHLCHVGSACSFHLVCSTHLLDKHSVLEQERSSLYHLVCVKVLCVCVFFKPRASTIPSLPCGIRRVPSILFAPRIS